MAAFLYEVNRGRVEQVTMINPTSQPYVHKKIDNSNAPGNERKITATRQETRTQKHKQQSTTKGNRAAHKVETILHNVGVKSGLGRLQHYLSL